MGVLAKLRAKLKRPSEPLADEYTAVGYKERAKRIKWRQRKRKAKETAEKITKPVKGFGEGLLKGAGVKPPKKPSAESIGKRLGKSLKKAAKPKKVSTRNRTARPPSWDIGTGLFDFGFNEQPRRRRRRKSDDIPWWLK